MKSIGARLTFYYALATTLSAALLFVAGYLLLESRLVKGLDDLNRTAFSELRLRMGSDFRSLSPKVINERIRETADASSALFFINVDVPKSGMVFYSHNLDGKAIPDIKGLHQYSVSMDGPGEVRVGEFIMPPFDVTIATPMAQARETMDSYVAVCAGLLAIMLLLSAAVGFGLSRVILRPLNFIRETAARIGSDNLGERIPVPAQRDEMSDLAILLNQMFDRLEKSFEQIKRFSAEASHELKTPLSLIRLHAERLLENGDLDSAATEAVIVQLDEVARLNNIIEEMLFLSRAEAKAIPLDLKSHDPAPMLRSFEQDAAVLAEHQGKNFCLSHDGVGELAFEERWLRQVWLNLLSNALNASPPGSTVWMRSTFTRTHWQVSVEDEGSGLNAQQIAHMFDRFRQFEKDAREGSGLGLAIARSIVELHAGTISAQNRPGCVGLSVTVAIPASNVSRPALA